MPTIIGNTDGIGARLRAERDRLRLSQTELARIGGVSRNSQTAYETGKTPFTSDYLALVAEAGGDALFIITGSRSAGAMDNEQASILAAFDALGTEGRNAVLYLVCSLAKQSMPAKPLTLPSTAALTDAFGSLLKNSPGLAGDELAHELAMRLPTILRSAEDEIAMPASGLHDDLAERRGGRGAGHRAGLPARHS